MNEGIAPSMPGASSAPRAHAAFTGENGEFRELADRLPCPVVLAETFGWSSDAMEAQAFAYLAARREKSRLRFQ